MNTLLVFATDKERAAAVGALGCPAAEIPGGLTFWPHGGRNFLALTAGIGPAASALRLGAALARTIDLAGCVNLGVAGTFDPETAPIGSVVAATGETWPEFGLRSGEDVDPAGLRLPQMTTPRGPVRDRLALDPKGAAQAMGIALPAGTVFGESLTVAGVTATAKGAAAMRERYGALTENMEGFSLALGCEEAGLPFLELRIVSNIVGSRDKKDWDLAGALASLEGLFTSLTAPISPAPQ